MTSWLTPRRAIAAAAAVAALVYANSVPNGWAGDDVYIVFGNERAHSIGAAWAARFTSYWPPPYEVAGLYRPLTVLTYGIDWTLSSGQPWLFHLNNILLHAVATALLVALALRWLPVPGALAAGVMFAVHPVHTEAVIGVVGRAELLGALGLLASVLAARRYRDAADARTARRWLAACLGVLLLGLLSKEHAAIAIAVLAVDQWLDPVPRHRPMWPLYLGVLWVTVGWFFLWHGVAGEFVSSGATSALYGLTWAQRVSHMMPVQLELVRLLVWPMQLAGDYSPLTVPLRPEWGTLATLGLIVAASLIALGLVVARRAPAVAFGILVAAGSYAPTANLFFASGVVIAERALYLAVLAPALVFGWLFSRVTDSPHRRPALAGAALLLVVFAGRTVARAPYYQDPQEAVLIDLSDHPENYREHLYLGELLAFGRDTVRAFAEFMTAAALHPGDPLSGRFTVRSALRIGRTRAAVSEARRVNSMAPENPQTWRWLVQAYTADGRRDSALAIALRGAWERPDAVAFVRTYQTVLRDHGAPAWRQYLIDASEDWLSGRMVQASARLDSLGRSLVQAARGPSFCDDLGIASTAVRALNPALLGRARDAAMRAGRPCGGLS